MEVKPKTLKESNMTDIATCETPHAKLEVGDMIIKDEGNRMVTQVYQFPKQNRTFYHSQSARGLLGKRTLKHSCEQDAILTIWNKTSILANTLHLNNEIIVKDKLAKVIKLANRKNSETEIKVWTTNGVIYLNRAQKVFVTAN